MDILKYMGSFEIQANDEGLLLKFLNEKEVEIKESILALWLEFSAEKNAVLKDQAFVVNNEEEGAKHEISIEPNLGLTIEEDNKSILVPENKESILPKDANTLHLKDKTNLKSEKMNLVNNNSSSFELQLINKNIIIPNGKVNKHYSYIFNFENISLNEIGDYWFEGLEKIGLTFNPETNEISGTPVLDGDHKINLKVKRIDWSEGKPIFERQITLIINPDPRSLWKNIPTPIEIEYYKSDSDKSFVKVESTSNIFGIKKTAKKDMVAASQRGRSHAQEGKPRDDDFAIHYNKEHDWYIMTVADGAGSALASRKGSEIACKTVVDVCQSMINKTVKDFEHQIKEFSLDKSDAKRKSMGDNLYTILGNAVFKALKNIEEESKLANRPLKDFATTLIVSICKKFKFGWFVGAFWVGDGGIGIYNKENQFLRILGESDGGEYAGQTRFLTMAEITQPTELYRRLRFDIVDEFTALILMTDGITDPKFETDANLFKIEKWNEFWQDLSSEVDFSDDNEASADQLLYWLDFWSPGNHDDRTIAILF